MKHIARKRFGQHFLVDAAIIESIVSAIDPRPHQALVEIGPGLGALTLPLLARGARLTVIELDRDLAQRLRQRGDVEVVQDDVLRVNFSELSPAAQAPLRIVGNLPYNISSPILFHLLPFAHQVQDQHFMLQSEVVYRMVAQPGHKAYGRLSVMLQWRYDMEVVVDVPPEAFDPPPAVNSAVIRMVPLAQPPALEAQRLSQLVTVAFSQRRKLLRHTLGRWLDEQGYSGEFDVQRRAEEVPVAQYVDLAMAVGSRT